MRGEHRKKCRSATDRTRKNRWPRRHRHAVVATIGLTVIAVAASLVISPQADASQRRGPVQTNWQSAVMASIADPDLWPIGMNRRGCRSTDGRRPVVLLNGAFLNKYATWSKFSPQLATAGFCVYGLDYGGPADGPFHQVGALRSSAVEIKRFIDRVRAETGSPEVDVVGYSEGGMVPFYYLNVLGGAPDVGTLVTLASPVRGMSGYGILDAVSSIPQARRALARVLPAAVDGAAGSSYFAEVGEGGLTRPGVRYVSVSSVADLVVMPDEARFPAARNVTNVVVQDHCPQDHVFHGSIIYDDTALGLVQNALEPAADRVPRCTRRGPLG